MATEARRTGTKRARTRARLIDAAAALIGELGFEGTSLEAVARRAGMSRGAIYGNFKDRNDLFLAVLEARWRPAAPAFKPGGSLAEQMRLLAEAVAASLPARRAAALGAASFRLYALTHEPMRRRIAEINAETYRRMAEGLLAVVPAEALPMPAEDFVRVLHGTIEGLEFLHALTPELVPEQVIVAALTALGRGPELPRRSNPQAST